MVSRRSRENIEKTKKIVDLNSQRISRGVLFILIGISIELKYSNVEAVSPELDHGNKAIDNTKSVCHEVCTSEACQKEALSYLHDMDQNIDPCDNFYEFVCGNFIKNSIIPGDATRIDKFNIVKKQIEKEVEDIMTEEIKEDELSTFKKMKRYYQNCMNETRIEDDGTKPILEVLNDLGGWPVLIGDKWKEDKFSWIEAILKKRKHGYNPYFPVNINVDNDPLDKTKQIIRVDNPVVRVSSYYLNNGTNNKRFNNYHRHVTNIAVKLGAKNDTALQEMREAIYFEVLLYNETFGSESPADARAKRMTIKELSQSNPSIPWLGLINNQINPDNPTIDENEVVLVFDTWVISKLEKFIANYPKRAIANYLLLTIVQDALGHLPDSLFKVSTPRSKHCYEDVNSAFSTILSAIYVRKYFLRKTRQNILELTSNVKKQFKKIIEEVDWMDNETRISALEKIDALTTAVRYSDTLFDDNFLEEYFKDLNIDHGSYLKSAKNISTFIYKKAFGKIRDNSDWTVTTQRTSFLNAVYYPSINEFALPVGFIKAFFHDEWPKYITYGTIGFVSGHEMAHGFDTRGRLYDKNGNEVDWWKNETEDKFLRKVNCTIDQYNRYTYKKLNLTLNGKRTLGDNIADNGGIRTAYYAYNEWAKTNSISEPCLPGLNYTAKQMFWISSANIWCNKQTEKSLRNTILGDYHSPAEARVIIPRSNMPEFAEDFKCQPKSRMNPETRCRVW